MEHPDAVASVVEHYRDHLAPVYLWMSGGLDASLARGEAEIAACFPGLTPGTLALDLGAGFGMHAIPLARRGCPVVAIDTSATLLAILRDQARGLPVRVIEDDLLSFARHIERKADIILCMGDTLAHLASRESVEALFDSVAESLLPGGTFLASFRDYSSRPQGSARFIPVRSDADRILTCFLEYGEDHVDVHDVLHERRGGAWELRVSAYRKVRLSPTWVTETLEGRGLRARSEPGPGGMIRVIATRDR